MSYQGGVEKNIITLSKSLNIPVEEIVEHFAYLNGMKLECLKLLNGKGVKVEDQTMLNCVNKYHKASVILNEISNKINI